MDITIDGLSKRQRAIADILWTLNTEQEVHSFINSLPRTQQDEARTVMTMMTWAMLDTVMDIELARGVLERLK